MSERLDEHLGQRLRRRRRALGMTQQDVGLALGMRFQQIQKYECATNRMSASVLWRLAAILQVEVSYFFEGLEADPTLAPLAARPRHAEQPVQRIAAR